MSEDTAPIFGRAPRIKRTIRIREINTPPIQMFDVEVTYDSDNLPEWFAPMQAIVEDEVFSSMVIYLGNGRGGGFTRYHIEIVWSSIQEGL